MKNSLSIIFSVLILLASAACATDVGGNFQGKDATKNFNTTMRLLTDFNMSIASGDVVSGDPANLQSGDTVCGGATIRVSGATTARWAVSTLNIASLYPACSGLAGDYCPAMINAGTLTNNRDIAWIDPAVYNTEAAFAYNNGFTQDPSHRTALGGVFYNEPVTYNNGTVETPRYWYNKEGGANIFCKGTFQVRDGTTVRGTSALPSMAPVDFTINATATTTHSIETSLSNVSCFAALEKHPLDLTNNYYRLYYFGRNLPAMPASLATDTVTINVVSSGGNCSMSTTAISVSRSTANVTGTTMVRTRIHNNADAIRVLNVSSSDPQFSAIPFPISLCSVLGFGSLCPPSNGFNQTVNSGANDDLYTLVTTSAASGGTMLTFNAETISGACGASSRCTATAPINDTPATCTIVPPGLTVAPREIAEFNVACQDLAGASVSCVGSNWAADTVLAGTFLEADETHSRLYSDATPHVTGNVIYTSSNAIASCNSTLNVVHPEDIVNRTVYNCSFMPPRADMTYDEERYFELHCAANRTITIVPNDFAYDTVNGLIGNTSNDSVNGVTYTAPSAPSRGDLQGAAYFGDHPPYILGAVALAPINVSNQGGDAYYCDIQPNSTSVGQNMAGVFTVTCRNRVNVTVSCTGNAWAWSGISGGFIAAETDNTHAWAYPTSPVGSVGLLTYTSGQALCNSTVTVVQPNYSCQFNPASAKMSVNKTQYFQTLVYDLRGSTPTRINATNVIYDLIGGLGGSHTNDSVAGTQYNAPDYNTSGQLQGAAVVDMGPPPMIPVCLAPIAVGGTGGGNNDGGSTEWCTIFGSTDLYPGYVGWVSIWCGPKANQTCTGVVWGQGIGVQTFNGTNMGTYILVTTANGTKGEIDVYVGGDPKHSCSLPFTSGARDCADLS
ncbi:MAG: hypothetical protein PHV13_01990 [Candidatus ainarchaeum sp.]|nr:hypothetical protein [Candidatus ainarchaeum sp.]